MAEEEGVSQASHVSSTQGTQGQCPTCWRSISLTKDGKIRVHGPISNRCLDPRKLQITQDPTYLLTLVWTLVN